MTQQPKKRKIRLMRIGHSELFKSSGYWWAVRPFHGLVTSSGVDGPYCPNCYSDMHLNEEGAWDMAADEEGTMYRVKDWEGYFNCYNCGKKHKTNLTKEELEHEFLSKYVSAQRSKIPKVSLDEPPAQVKVRDEDDKYFIAAKIGQKDGKRVGIVYFGEKVKQQAKEDYSQIFIDLDEEQLRFDKSNMHPNKILSEFKAVFKDSEYTSKSKK